MSDQEAFAPTVSAILAALGDEQRSELEHKQYLKVGKEIVWIEPEGSVRREPVEKLYYIRTRRGVFRVSRISEEVVEV